MKSNPKIIFADSLAWIAIQFALYPDTIVIINDVCDGARVIFRDEKISEKAVGNIPAGLIGTLEKGKSPNEFHMYPMYKFVCGYEMDQEDVLQLAYWIVRMSLSR